MNFKTDVYMVNVSKRRGINTMVRGSSAGNLVLTLHISRSFLESFFILRGLVAHVSHHETSKQHGLVVDH